MNCRLVYVQITATLALWHMMLTNYETMACWVIGRTRSFPGGLIHWAGLTVDPPTANGPVRVDFPLHATGRSVFCLPLRALGMKEVGPYYLCAQRDQQPPLPPSVGDGIFPGQKKNRLSTALLLNITMLETSLEC